MGENQGNRELDTRSFAPIIVTMFKYIQIIIARICTHAPDRRSVNSSSLQVSDTVD